MSLDVIGLSSGGGGPARDTAPHGLDDALTLGLPPGGLGHAGGGLGSVSHVFALDLSSNGCGLAGHDMSGGGGGGGCATCDGSLLLSTGVSVAVVKDVLLSNVFIDFDDTEFLLSSLILGGGSGYVNGTTGAGGSGVIFSKT